MRETFATSRSRYLLPSLFRPDSTARHIVPLRVRVRARSSFSSDCSSHTARLSTLSGSGCRPRRYSKNRSRSRNRSSTAGHASAPRWSRRRLMRRTPRPTPFGQRKTFSPRLYFSFSATQPGGTGGRRAGTCICCGKKNEISIRNLVDFLMNVPSFDTATNSEWSFRAVRASCRSEEQRP